MCVGSFCYGLLGEQLLLGWSAGFDQSASREAFMEPNLSLFNIEGSRDFVGGTRFGNDVGEGAFVVAFDL